MLVFCRYLLVGLKWIHSVLKRWRGELKTSGSSSSSSSSTDLVDMCVSSKEFQLHSLLPSEICLNNIDCCKQHGVVKSQTFLQKFPGL